MQRVRDPSSYSCITIFILQFFPRLNGRSIRSVLAGFDHVSATGSGRLP